MYHIDPDAGVARAVPPGDLAETRVLPGWVWLDVVDASDGEIEEIAATFGFDPLAVEDLTVPTVSPKVDEYRDQTFVVLHGVAADEREFRTVEYDTFVGADHLVVFRPEDLPGFAWVREQIVAAGHRLPEAPDRLFARLVETGGVRFGALADAVEDHSIDLEEQALEGAPAVIGECQALRRDAVRLRKVLLPQRATVRRLAQDEHTAIGERARMRLRSALDAYDRASESIEASRSLLALVMETYRATVAERANEVMKVLTVFAAIMLPLTFMAGVYGMNFASMPELGWRWGYPILVGLMAAVGLGLWAYFARRGFIGGPRLSTLPRAVGAGLAGLVRATTRPMGLIGRRAGGEPPDDGIS